jgi:hypothetical protein
MFDTELTITKLADKLSKGLGGWLMYEHHSHRADLFSEKYLAAGIGNILSGNFRDKVITEFNHPILQNRKAGRPPQIDFVIYNEGKINLAVESKWFGTKTSSSPKTIDVVWDLIRLEILNFNFNSNALFIIAGKKSQIDEFFTRLDFIDKTTTGKSRNLLPTKNSEIILDLIGCSIDRLKIICKLSERYKTVEFPSKIKISRLYKFPTNASNFENEVCVWCIKSVENTKRYKYQDLFERIAKRESKLIELSSK